MKSHNKNYVALLVVLIAGFTVFFSSKAWLPDDRSKQNLNYNEIIGVGGWNLCISGAQYDKESGTMTCSLYQKAQTDSAGEYTITVFNGNSSLKKKLKYTVRKTANNPDYETLKITGIPSDYYYVTVELSAENDGMNSTMDVRIDYRIASQITSQTSS